MKILITIVLLAIMCSGCATTDANRVEHHLQSLRALYHDRSLTEDAWHAALDTHLKGLICLGHFEKRTIQFRHLDLDDDIVLIMNTIQATTDTHPEWLGSIEVFDSGTGVEERNERLVTIERPELCTEIEKTLRSIDKKANKVKDGTAE